MSDPRIRPMGTGLELYGEKQDGGEYSVDIALGRLTSDERYSLLPSYAMSCLGIS
jgi:hypothetical protein